MTPPKPDEHFFTPTEAEMTELGRALDGDTGREIGNLINRTFREGIQKMTKPDTPTLARLTQLLDREIARAEAAELEARKARESAEALQRVIDTLKGLA